MVGLYPKDEAEKGWACGTYGEKRGAHRFLVEKTEGKKITWKKQPEKITLESIFQESAGSVDWIDLARETDRWEAFLYSVIKVRIPQKAGSFLTS